MSTEDKSAGIMSIKDMLTKDTAQASKSTTGTSTKDESLEIISTNPDLAYHQRMLDKLFQRLGLGPFTAENLKRLVEEPITDQALGYLHTHDKSPGDFKKPFSDPSRYHTDAGHVLIKTIAHLAAVHDDRLNELLRQMEVKRCAVEKAKKSSNPEEVMEIDEDLEYLWNLMPDSRKEPRPDEPQEPDLPTENERSSRHTISKNHEGIQEKRDSLVIRRVSPPRAERIYSTYGLEFRATRADEQVIEHSETGDLTGEESGDQDEEDDYIIVLPDGRRISHPDN